MPIYYALTQDFTIHYSVTYYVAQGPSVKLMIVIHYPSRFWDNKNTSLCPIDAQVYKDCLCDLVSVKKMIHNL